MKWAEFKRRIKLFIQIIKAKGWRNYRPSDDVTFKIRREKNKEDVGGHYNVVDGVTIFLQGIYNLNQFIRILEHEIIHKCTMKELWSRVDKFDLSHGSEPLLERLFENLYNNNPDLNEFEFE